MVMYIKYGAENVKKKGREAKIQTKRSALVGQANKFSFELEERIM